MSAYQPRVHEIKAIFPGVYWTLLDFPTSKLLTDLLTPDVPFVLCWGHYLGNYTWQEFRLPVTSPTSPIKVLSRGATFDFVVSTEEFLALLPSLGLGISVVQLRQLPPTYLDLARIKGSERYRLLSECGWELEFETPGNDFGQMASPHKHLLEQAIKLLKRNQ